MGITVQAISFNQARRLGAKFRNFFVNEELLK
jgi:hypothetical protein